jgi:hypothetical protein
VGFKNSRIHDYPPTQPPERLRSFRQRFRDSRGSGHAQVRESAGQLECLVRSSFAIEHVVIVCCAPALAVETGIGYREVWRFCAHPEQVARNITSMRVML